MRVGLFIPCYMDAFEPEVGVATLELLERLGCTVEYPVNQTCCGQPMTNTGCHQDAAAAEALFARNFSGYDYVVAPSGSCVHQVRVNMTAIEQTPEVRAVRERTFELTEFLHDILKVRNSPGHGFRTRSVCTITVTACVAFNWPAHRRSKPPSSPSQRRCSRE
jgi:L-lactate dehydrogenase complex protein LldE